MVTAGVFCIGLKPSSPLVFPHGCRVVLHEFISVYAAPRKTFANNRAAARKDSWPKSKPGHDNRKIDSCIDIRIRQKFFLPSVLFGSDDLFLRPKDTSRVVQPRSAARRGIKGGTPPPDTDGPGKESSNKRSQQICAPEGQRNKPSAAPGRHLHRHAGRGLGAGLIQGTGAERAAIIIKLPSGCSFLNYNTFDSQTILST